MVTRFSFLLRLLASVVGRFLDCCFGSMAVMPVQGRIHSFVSKTHIAALAIGLSKVVAHDVELIADLLPSMGPHGSLEDERGALLRSRGRFQGGKRGAVKTHGQLHGSEKLILCNTSRQLLGPHSFGTSTSTRFGRQSTLSDEFSFALFSSLGSLPGFFDLSLLGSLLAAWKVGQGRKVGRHRTFATRYRGARNITGLGLIGTRTSLGTATRLAPHVGEREATGRGASGSGAACCCLTA